MARRLSRQDRNRPVDNSSTGPEHAGAKAFFDGAFPIRLQRDAAYAPSAYRCILLINP